MPIHPSISHLLSSLTLLSVSSLPAGALAAESEPGAAPAAPLSQSADGSPTEAGAAPAAPSAQPEPEPEPVAETVQPAPAPVVDITPASGTASEEEDGDDEERSAKSKALSLAITGWTLTGVSYGTSLIVGAIRLDVDESATGQAYGRWMLAPVVGPIGAATHSRTSTGVLFTLSLAAMQATGLTLGIVGTVRRSRLRRVNVAAMPTRDGGRVALAMRF